MGKRFVLHELWWNLRWLQQCIVLSYFNYSSVNFSIFIYPLKSSNFTGSLCRCKIPTRMLDNPHYDQLVSRSWIPPRILVALGSFPKKWKTRPTFGTSSMECTPIHSFKKNTNECRLLAIHFKVLLTWWFICLVTFKGTLSGNGTIKE